MKKIYVILISLVMVLALLVSAGFGFETERTLSLPGEGLKELRIGCAAGRLEVVGVEGLDRIEVRAAVNAEGVGSDKMDAYIKERVHFSLEKRGDRAVLESRIEGRIGFFITGDAWIDLEVRMPRALALEIDDGSGAIVVEDVGGDVVIDDNTGEIRVARLGGSLEIDDGSGDIDVRRVAGDVSVDDGSGDIDILGTGGSVKVDDGSGDIVVDGVGKDAIVEDSGSGDVRIDNVKGRVIRHDVDEDAEEDED
jgi:hypothetical protein